MHQDEFRRLATQDYNRIPVVREVLADMDTPLSIYLKLADAPYSYLLESVQGGEKWGRYSIIGLPARTVLKVHGHGVRIQVDGVETESHQCDDPLAFVEQFKARYRVPDVPGCPDSAAVWSAISATIVCAMWSRGWPNRPTPTRWATDILLMVSDRWWCSTTWRANCTS